MLVLVELYNNATFFTKKCNVFTYIFYSVFCTLSLGLGNCGEDTKSNAIASVPQEVSAANASCTFVDSSAFKAFDVVPPEIGIEPSEFVSSSSASNESASNESASNESAPNESAPNESASGSDAAGVISLESNNPNESAGNPEEVDTSGNDINASTSINDPELDAATSASELVIESVSVQDTTTNSATIAWSLNIPASGQVEYGTTESLGEWIISNLTVGTESSIKLTNLTEGTTYFYQVSSIDQYGQRIVSATQNFKTGLPAGITTDVNEQVEIGSDFPSVANGNLPLAGLFYGNPSGGLITTNMPIAVESSRRFRAEKSGFVNAVRFHNRVLSNRDITSKCSKQGSSSTWCKCEKAGLDAYTCGYTIGSSYSVGNGGLIHIELRADDGDGLPSDIVLGRSDSFVPLELSEQSSSHYVNVSLSSNEKTQMGKLYHLVFVNTNPPSNCKLSGNTVSQASSCPRNQGAISLNGLYDTNISSSTGRWGPYLGDSSANLYRSTTSSSWEVAEKGISFYELHYDDGVKVGESYHSLDGMTSGQGTQTIGGTNHARQVFTVRGASRRVDGLWVYAGHASTTSSATLDVELKNASGAVIASGSAEQSKHCISESSSKCRDWIYAAFTGVAELIEGDLYSVELSSSKKAFLLTSTQALSVSHGFDDRNDWDEARAELSTDSGRSWDDWTSQLAKYRDLVMLFTLENMPKQLP